MHSDRPPDESSALTYGRLDQFPGAIRGARWGANSHRYSAGPSNV
jgi:hypothetical protein